MANEKRLIDANALTDEVLNHPKPYRRDFYRMLKDAPTVDAVEVVRCKECQCWIHIGDGIGDCTNGRFHLDDCPDPTMSAEEF